MKFLVWLHLELCLRVFLLVSFNSGIGKAMKEVPYGSHCVVNSKFNIDDPIKWTEAIKAVYTKESKLG